MDKMTKYDLVPITKTFYDSLEEGTILGRKCTRCGHIEFPPYLCCNACGCLDTEWVDLTNMRGIVKGAIPTRGAFGNPDFRAAQGDYFAVEIELENLEADPITASLLRVDYDKYDEFTEYIKQQKVEVKPLLFQDEDMKVVAWELVEDGPFKKYPEIKAAETLAQKEAPLPAEETALNKEEADVEKPVQKTDASAEYGEIEQAVLQAVADAFDVEVEELSMDTDIREDLSNESMKMIVMISTIEDELDVTIEIQEASLLKTIGDFVAKVKERL